jgi:hypothetical protein
MNLLPNQIREQMLANGANPDAPHKPVVKLFTPDANATWLLTELDPEDPDIAFGLCDLGLGCPELGYVSISELESVRGKLGLPVERDVNFSPTKSIIDYAEESRKAGAILA